MGPDNRYVKHSTLFALSATAFGLLFSLLGVGEATALGQDARQEVRSLALEWANAFRVDGGTPFARLQAILADDFVQVGGDGNVYQGKDTNVALYRKGIDGIRDGFHEFNYRYDIQRVEILGDGALVFGKLIQTGRPKAGDLFHQEVWETLVFRREAGTWRLIHEGTIIVGVPKSDAK